MNKRDYSIIGSCVVAALLLVAAAWPLERPGLPSLWTCAILTGLAALAQLYAAEAPDSQTYYPHYIFFFAGIMLLPPGLLLPLIAIPHLVEMAVARVVRGALPFPWPVQIFNIAMHLVAGLTAVWVERSFDLLALGGAGVLAAPLAAALTYVVLNHLIVGLVLVLINGLTWGDSGVLGSAQLELDFVLCCLGYVFAVLWQLNPWLVLPAVGPLLLMTRALRVPRLEHEAQTDAKTGLLNARYLQSALEEEFQQARRQERRLALIMADLDYLRTVNNTYGHLAGDAVINAVGGVIRRTIRSSDKGGRFGGEEFMVILPGTGRAEAALVAERVRAAVEALPVAVASSPQPVSVTMSLGVAELNPAMTSVTDLTDAADVAVYAAKSRGRNRVVVATEELCAEARRMLNR